MLRINCRGIEHPKIPVPLYKNLSGISGIKAYELGDDYIIITFNKESIYLYDYEKPGKAHVEQMKKLAEKGLGLNTYISQNVHNDFKKRLR